MTYAHRRICEERCPHPHRQTCVLAIDSFLSRHVHLDFGMIARALFCSLHRAKQYRMEKVIAIIFFYCTLLFSRILFLSILAIVHRDDRKVYASLEGEGRVAVCSVGTEKWMCLVWVLLCCCVDSLLSAHHFLSSSYIDDKSISELSSSSLMFATAAVAVVDAPILRGTCCCC